MLDTACSNQRGETVLSGTATVMAPGQCVTRPRLRLSEVTLKHSDRYDSIMAQARVLPSLSAAIVHPCSPEAILAAIEVRDEGLLQPLLVGPEAKIQAAAAARAVELAVSGQAAALMKGSFHSDELLGAVVASGSGLTTERRICHVYAMSLPAYPKPRLVEDLLYRRSGLLGVSGISPDSRDLLDSERPEAHEALDLFCFRIAGEVGPACGNVGRVRCDRIHCRNRRASAVNPRCRGEAVEMVGSRTRRGRQCGECNPDQPDRCSCGGFRNPDRRGSCYRRGCIGAGKTNRIAV